MNNKRGRSIIYVNFSPYENTGKILDYLLDSFKYVFLFSFNFHKLGRTKEDNKLYVFHNKRIVKKYDLYQIPVPLTLIFLLLPLRSILIFIQIFLYTLYLRKKYSTIDYYFTVNAFTAWSGQIVKKVGLVKKTVFWVWDYYPPIHENKIIKFMRRVYWYFDKISSRSDHLIFLNERLKTLREKIGIISKGHNFPIIPIGTCPNFSRMKSLKDSLSLGFMGVLKKSQGLDLIFDNLNELGKIYPNLKIDIIGSGPDEKYFRNRAKCFPVEINFHGFLSERKYKKINKILSGCSIGIAPYVPEKSNVSYYGDPSKIKMYLSFGLPVITTNVFAFSEELKETKSGIIIDYYKKNEFIKAVNTIKNNYLYYQTNAKKLAKKYFYKKLYSSMFEDLYNNY